MQSAAGSQHCQSHYCQCALFKLSGGVVVGTHFTGWCCSWHAIAGGRFFSLLKHQIGGLPQYGKRSTVVLSYTPAVTPTDVEAVITDHPGPMMAPSSTQQVGSGLPAPGLPLPGIPIQPCTDKRSEFCKRCNCNGGTCGNETASIGCFNGTFCWNVGYHSDAGVCWYCPASYPYYSCGNHRCYP